jgi:hypothetical protein
VLSDVARGTFIQGAGKLGLTSQSAEQAAARVTSGDLAGLLAATPPAVRESLRSVALDAYGAGFASAALVACCVSLIAFLPAFGVISEEETAPAMPASLQKMPCKFIDCRDPL